MKTFLACSLLVAALFTCGGAETSVRTTTAIFNGTHHVGGSSTGGLQGDEGETPEAGLRSPLPGESGGHNPGPITGASDPRRLPGERGGENPGPLVGGSKPKSLPGESGERYIRQRR
uniref:Putative secreted protein n=1 Tax=Amblyomma americanum TaxID=6943 RepID=A0A0C9S3Y7_AMBAM